MTEQKHCQPSTTNPSSDDVYCIQGNCIDRSDTAGCNGKGWRTNESFTLNTVDHHAVCQPTPDKETSNDVITVSHGGFMTNADDSGKAQTLQASDYKNPQIVAFDSYDLRETGDKGRCLTAAGGGKSQCGIQEGQSPTLATTHGGEPVVCYGLDRASFNQGKNAKYDFSVEEDKAQTIVSSGPGGVMTLSEAYVQETRKE